MCNNPYCKVPSCTVSYGECHCGCGEKTNIADRNRKARGQVKGEPVLFIHTHRARGDSLKYLVNEETGCWEWQRYTDKDGYGQIKINKVNKRAHVAYYEALVGEIPRGLILDHLCRNPSCVNPEHLEPVTNIENTRRGNAAKITMKEAKEIRDKYPDFNLKTLGGMYGISFQQVSRIVNNQAWVGEDKTDAILYGP